jgi:hypothetical protein
MDLHFLIGAVSGFWLLVSGSANRPAPNEKRETETAVRRAL